MRIILLIIFSNLFATLLGWDLLGVTSFFLVIYYKNRKRLSSGMITALTNRIGDCMLFCCLGFFCLGEHIVFFALLILIRMTKSAQIPFSSWLPAAIAAPTPVRALVHSSTLVTAGVYVLIRYIYIDSVFLLWVGSLTILMAGSVACFERDIKKIVALRTLSQLGVMMVRVRSQQKAFCFFHLLSHAGFKALLFICVGTVIHSIYGRQEYRGMNGISTLLISLFAASSSLSLMGFPFTSGFFRKDKILENMLCNGANLITIIIFLLSIGITACYSIKLITTILTPGHTGIINVGGQS